MTNQTNAPAAAPAAATPWYKNRTTKMIGGAVLITGLGVVAERKFGLGSKLISMVGGGAGVVADAAGSVADAATAAVGFFRK